MNNSRIAYIIKTIRIFKFYYILKRTSKGKSYYLQMQLVSMQSTKNCMI